jgi:5-methyltetrahydrofolate--homocysteine methyltransferase
MTLTEAGQIIPDHSTAAIFIHHPDAEYFTL